MAALHEGASSASSASSASTGPAEHRSNYVLHLLAAANSEGDVRNGWRGFSVGGGVILLDMPQTTKVRVELTCVADASRQSDWFDGPVWSEDVCKPEDRMHYLAATLQHTELPWYDVRVEWAPDVLAWSASGLPAFDVTNSSAVLPAVLAWYDGLVFPPPVMLFPADVPQLWLHPDGSATLHCRRCLVCVLGTAAAAEFSAGAAACGAVIARPLHYCAKHL